MPLRVLSVLSSLALSACSVVGIREAEEPRFDVVDRVGTVEIRQYGVRLAAETLVEGGDEYAARNEGFRRLAAFIFGANTSGDSIAMTAPVAQAQAQAASAAGAADKAATGAGGEQIDMTAPVAQARAAEGGGWRIRFFMPASYTLLTLPRPRDARVQIVEVPGETMAVLRYSGVASPATVAAKARELAAALEPSPWRAQGAVLAWFYDPPWTLPPLRRNEAVVPVARR